jgi:hypothetical protein
MTRYRPYSRRVFRGRFAAWAKTNAKLIAGLTFGLAAIAAIVTTIIVTTGASSDFSWYVLGAFHAILFCAYLHLMHLAYLTHDRAAMGHLRGALGEENTRSELQRAKRRRLVWGWVDSIGLQIGDLDHLVVTRHGGLLAIDSKWRSTVTRDDLAEIARTARRMQLRAEGLVQSLWKAERGSRHRARTNPLSVRPVVVLWGPAQHEVPDHAVVDGVQFIAGIKLLDWLKQLEGDAVSKQAGRHAIELLTAYRAATWDTLTRGGR